MRFTDAKFSPLSEQFDLSKFDCGDTDINEFLKEDALNYQKEHFAKTYISFLPESNILGFFCLSNDCLTDKGSDKGKVSWNRLHTKQSIPNEKRIKQYPSIKIGRLGVHKDLHKTGFAYEMMYFIKGFATYKSKSACRFLLLDAYNKERQINYYKENDFEFVSKEDSENKTRLMYFDLSRFYAK